MAKATDIQEPEVEETEVEATVIRPTDLAKELSVDAKRVRAFLRQKFPRAAEAKNTSWALSSEQVDAVRARFTPDEDEETEDES